MKTAVFTIANARVLPNAWVFMDSARRFLPSAERFVILSERPAVHESLSGLSGFPLVNWNQMGIEDGLRLAFRYDATEFRAVLKPWGFSYLFQQGFDRVLYFDPHVEFFSAPDEISQGLENGQAVVTPFITEPLEPDGYFPSNAAVVRMGQFHSGFLGLKQSPQVCRFLKFWQKEVTTAGHREPAEWWYGEQLFMNLMASIVENTRIIFHRSYHLGLWNLQQRSLGTKGTCDGPLVFVNFRDIFDLFLPIIDGSVVSPINVGSPIRPTPRNPTWEQLFQGYCAREFHASTHLGAVPKTYSYGYYDNGAPIGWADRRSYHLTTALGLASEDPFSAAKRPPKNLLVYPNDKLAAELHHVHTELSSMINGPSWRIGRALTWPGRFIRDQFR